jgi:Protein of unknown function (DUF3052)
MPKAPQTLSRKEAVKEALKLRYPSSRLDKLGVKDTSIVSVLNVDDETFATEVTGRTPTVSFGRTHKHSTMIIYGVTALTDLNRLTKLRETIAQDGAIWVVWPKGRKEKDAVKEDHVRRAAIAQGLVDIKVMSFSDTLSGLKLVIPIAQRKREPR